MQACWNVDPKLRPTSRDLEIAFTSWVDSIAQGKLDGPTISPTIIEDVSLQAESDGSSSISVSVYNTSQSIPPLSSEQENLLEVADKRRTYIHILDC